MGLSLAIVLLSLGWFLLYSAIKDLDPLSELSSIFTGQAQTKRPAPTSTPPPAPGHP